MDLKLMKQFIRMENMAAAYCPTIKNFGHKLRGYSGRNRPLTFNAEERSLLVSTLEDLVVKIKEGKDETPALPLALDFTAPVDTEVKAAKPAKAPTKKEAKAKVVKAAKPAKASTKKEAKAKVVKAAKPAKASTKKAPAKKAPAKKAAPAKKKKKVIFSPLN